MMEPRRVRQYTAPDGETVYVYRTKGSWVSEVRTDDKPGRIIGLVWQSGFYLTHRGALRAVRLFLHTGSPYAETLGHLAGWRSRFVRLPRVARIEEAT